MEPSLGERLIKAQNRIVDKFDAGNWEQLGLLTDSSDILDHHPRLYRSLSWNDQDYAGNALGVLRSIHERSPKNLNIIENYLAQNFPEDSEFISAKPNRRKITFAPYVFQIPEFYPEPDLVALMMPFSKEFDAISQSLKASSESCGFRCMRVDDLWEESAIIQDIFNLIFRSQVVIVDFSGRNSNVMYETGIAHTLGKHVIPISQSLDDVPFDMRHHRVLKYLPNVEGLKTLENNLSAKLRQYSPKGIV